ncbi:MAG: serine hydrolase [Gemmatimonadales bacterium]
MRISYLLLIGATLATAAAPVPAAAQYPVALRDSLTRLVAASGGNAGIAFLDLGTGDSLYLDAGRRYHAASTMKVPVLIELARRVDAGELAWDDSLPVVNEFRSIYDGSRFSVDPAEDSDSLVYGLIGRAAPVRLLAERMIEWSSNLATNILIERLDARRVDATAHALGADSISVLRGVEDLKAYEHGMSNTTTARDLAQVLAAIATGRAASPAGTAEMLRILTDQGFNDGIPAGLPRGTRVAHKTGAITRISHDAAIIYPPGRAPFVLVVLTQGFDDPADASRLQGQVAAAVWKTVNGER